MRTNTRTQGTLAVTAVTPINSKLLDRYVLPKVAMVLIVISAAAGTWLSLKGIGAVQPDLAVAKWIQILGISVVLGGSFWGAYFTQRHYEEQDVDSPPAFLRLEFGGFAAIQRYAALATVLAGAYAAREYSSLFRKDYAPWYDWLAILQVALGLGLLAVVLASRVERRAQTSFPVQQVQRRLKLTVLLSMLSLLTTAALDVVPFWGADSLVILVRWVHLVAVGLWFGGAVWNVFVAVPAARKTLSFETVFAAASQLEQFRKVVRFALPLVLLSGLYQSYRLMGFDVSALLSLPLGVLILLKLGLIATLVGIFITCPMWRACSPIAGVCDITDIDPTPKFGLNAGAEERELAARSR